MVASILLESSMRDEYYLGNRTTISTVEMYNK